jgi:glucose-6-phosphate dehydrogenase assembly protein OpcA
MTLIVVSRSNEEDLSLGETLAALMKEHPSRVIRIHLADSPDRALAARVTAQCWMPFGSKQQICCEQIQIDCSMPALADLPPVLRALTAPDLPVVLWLRDADLFDSPDVEVLFELAGKVTINSAGCPDPERILGDLLSLRQRGTLVADLSWTRLTRWRETLAQLFANPERRANIGDIDTVRVFHYGERPPVRALYIAGWLRNSIGARPQYHLEKADLLTPCQLDGEVQGAELVGPSIDVRISQTEGEMVELRAGDLVKTSVFHNLSDYDLLREELSIEGRDPVFDAALDAAITFLHG